MEKIKDNIYVETEFLGCNPSFVVTSNGIVMIDTPQKPLEALKWRKEIEKYGRVIYIINSDHHQDHALGNYFFEGDIIVHEGTMKKLLADDRVDICKDWIKLIDSRSGYLMDHYYVKKPRITYEDRMTLNLGSEVFELIHTQGHTQDETMVYMPRKKVLFTGDNVCTIGIPSLHECYLKGWLEALGLMNKMDFEALVPGHGKIGNKDSVRDFYREFSIFINRVKEKIDKGSSREEIAKIIRYGDAVHMKYPPEALEFFDRSMGMSIGRLYDELIKEGLGPLDPYLLG
jgi:cyclase